MKQNKIKAIICEPNEPPRVEYIAQDLHSLQGIVGGLIQVIYPHEDDTCIILNDEGKLMNLAMNRPLKDSRGAVYDVMCGTFIICACNDERGDFADLTDEQTAHYMDEYREPITDETADIYEPLSKPWFEFCPLDDVTL